jgi:hypothetical protein
MEGMKTLLAALVLGSALAACATPYTLSEGLSVHSSGVVESVREVPLDIHGFREAVEHSINPQTAQELVVRLDDARAVTLVEEVRRFAPGERVRIVAGLVERE